MSYRDDIGQRKELGHLVVVPVLIALAFAATTMCRSTAAPVERSQPDADIRIDLGVVSVRVTIA